MQSRASSSAATRGRVLEAATTLFVDLSYDRVSLADVASRAGVSLPTVLRKFGSKDGLFLECARRVSEQEREARLVPPGDVPAAARVLARRYEKILPFWKRHLDLEERFPTVARVVEDARRGHLAWLAEIFAPFLATRPGPARTRQLAALFGATEIYLWWSWRAHLGLSERDAEQVLIELLETLVQRWTGRERDHA